MLIMDMPDIPPQQASVIIEAKASQTNKDGYYGTVGVCFARPTKEEMSSEKDPNGEYDIAPRVYANNIFYRGSGFPQSHDLDYETSKISVLEAPKHGALSSDLSPGKIISYYPDAGYVGKDKVVLLVDIEGYKVKVVYFFKVVSNYEAGHKGLFKNICPDETNWFQISTSPTVIGLDSTIANLTGAAIGETQGEGADAAMTLTPQATPGTSIFSST